MRVPRLLLRSSLVALLVAVAACSSSAGTDTDPNRQPDVGPDPLECAADETECDDECIDLLSDEGNCGVCGRTCDAELVCDEGQCTSPEAACELQGEDPSASPALCDGRCADLNRDVGHCGACGSECAVGDACVMGACEGPPTVDSCAAGASGVLRTSIADIPLEIATVVASGLQHAYDVDELEAQGCVDHFELEVEMGTAGCTLKLIFASDEAGAGLVYASLDVDSFCPGFDDAQEGLYERTEGWAPAWFGLERIQDAVASETCVAGEWISFDDGSLRLLRSDGAELLIELHDLRLSGWIPSEQNTAGACVAEVSCGEAHDGGDGWCVFEGCSPDHHDGGDTTCVPDGECLAGYLIHRGDCSHFHVETLEIDEDLRPQWGPTLALGAACESRGACAPQVASVVYVGRSPSGSSQYRLLHVEEAAEGWHVDFKGDVVESRKIDFALDSQGRRHFCYFRWSEVSQVREVFHALDTADGWESTKLGESFYSGHCDMAIDSTDSPHVVFYERRPEASGWAVVHARQTVDAWVSEREEVLFLNGNPSIALGDDDVAHIIYGGYTEGLRYAVSDGNGMASVAVPGSIESYLSSIAVDHAGVPHIVYHDEENDRIERTWLGSSGWEHEVIDGANVYQGTVPAVVVDAESKLHVIYEAPSLTYAYQTSPPGEPVEWGHVDFLAGGDAPSMVIDPNGDVHVSYAGYTGIEYAIIASTHRCPEGMHDGGDGVCVPSGTCSEAHRDGGPGRCVEAPGCRPGYRDGGDGSVCVPMAECLPGFHDGGYGRCLPEGECEENYRDGGDGACVRGMACSPGHHDGGDGTVCLPSGTCLSGYHDGGEDQCLPIGECINDYHDGGDGTCVPRYECLPDYHNGGAWLCLPEGECRDGYYDGGDGACVSSGCSPGHHDGGDGVCLPYGECSSGYHDGGNGVCVEEGTCSYLYRDRGDGVCARESQDCLTGFHDNGIGDCVPEGTCAAGYHDGGDGVCRREGDCSQLYHDRGDGVCAPLDECLPGFVSEGSADCLRGYFEYVGDARSLMDIGLDSRGEPHIVYKASGQYGAGYFVWRDEEGDWATQQVHSAYGEYGGTSLATGPDGVPHIAYYDNDVGRIWHATKPLGASGWTTTIVDGEGLPGAGSAIAVDSTGTPHIGYRDYDNRKVKYAYFSSGQWYAETLPDPVPELLGLMTIAVDANDEPHLLYLTDARDQVRHAYREAGVWHFEVAPANPDNYGYRALVFDAASAAHLIFVDGDRAKYATRPAGAGAVWTTIDLGSYSYGEVAIALDALDRPHVLYRDHGTLVYAAHDGSDWVEVDVEAPGNIGVSGLGIVIGDDGTPHITYANGRYGELIPIL